MASPDQPSSPPSQPGGPAPRPLPVAQVPPVAAVPALGAVPVRADVDKAIGEMAGELWELTLAYAKQETVDPVKALGRWCKLGVPGALLLSVGVVFLLLAVLRAVQVEGREWLAANWSVAPYLLLVVLAVVVAVLAAKRIKGRATDG